jgi:hypothetical protein
MEDADGASMVVTRNWGAALKRSLCRTRRLRQFIENVIMPTVSRKSAANLLFWTVAGALCAVVMCLVS